MKKQKQYTVIKHQSGMHRPVMYKVGLKRSNPWRNIKIESIIAQTDVEAPSKDKAQVRAIRIFRKRGL